MRELRSKITEALISALPITLIVSILSLTPYFDFSATELVTFTIGAVLLILGIVAATGFVVWLCIDMANQVPEHLQSTEQSVQLPVETAETAAASEN